MNSFTAGDQYPLRDDTKQPKQVIYDRKYAISSYILLFFSFSFIGWVWEVSLHLFGKGEFVNRGVLFGPWIPIYGSGAVLILLFLKKVAGKRVLTFFLIMILCSIIEYFTSWLLEITKNMKWWDYSGYFLNLNGRICLAGAVVFGLGGCGCIYFLAPFFDNLYKKIHPPIKIIICIVLIALFSIDLAYSNINPNTGKGITDYAYNEYVFYTF